MIKLQIILFLVSMLAATICITSGHNTEEHDSFHEKHVRLGNVGHHGTLSQLLNGNAFEKHQKTNNTSKVKHWAFLVAGSKGWLNYRHQADICHAYHTLIKRGIPASNIIVMMKDDIVNNTQNPYPGKIFNELKVSNDVYAGVKIDYRNKDVTSTNFLNILQGNKRAMQRKGSGRVIESNKHDIVFVNFVDHGGYGLLGFPSDVIFASELNTSIKKLISKKRFGKLVLYIDACESGSMFDGILPSNKAVLASTAAGRYESSYACYCKHPKLPCLGDQYSVSWIETLDKFIKPVDTLFDQFNKVRTLTANSHVNVYGDYRVGYERTRSLLGAKTIKTVEKSQEDRNEDGYKTEYEGDDQLQDAVPSREASIHWLRKRLRYASNRVERQGYTSILHLVEKGRQAIDNVVEEILGKVTTGHNETKQITANHYPIKLELFSCYERIYKAFGEKCFNLYENDYTFSHLYKFYNLCYLNKTNEKLAITAMDKVCGEDTLLIRSAH